MEMDYMDPDVHSCRGILICQHKEPWYQQPWYWYSSLWNIPVTIPKAFDKSGSNVKVF